MVFHIYCALKIAIDHLAYRGGSICGVLFSQELVEGESISRRIKLPGKRTVLMLCPVSYNLSHSFLT